MAKDPDLSTAAVGGVLIGVKPLLDSDAAVKGPLRADEAGLALSGLPQGVGGRSALEEGV